MQNRSTPPMKPGINVPILLANGALTKSGQRSAFNNLVIFIEFPFLETVFTILIRWYFINSINFKPFKDCYDNGDDDSGSEQESVRQKRSANKFIAYSTVPPLRNPYTFVDQESLANRKSTDAFGGFPCNEKSTEYLNDPDVRTELHIEPTLGPWEDCKWVYEEKVVIILFHLARRWTINTFKKIPTQLRFSKTSWKLHKRWSTTKT